MPMLGDILAAARDSASDILIWLEAARPEIVARLRAAAELEGVTPSTYVRMTVADYGRLASEEDWAGMISLLREETEDPGTVCLLFMLEWRLPAAPSPLPAGDL